MGWSHVAEDSDSRFAVVSEGFHKMQRLFWLTEGLLGSQEGLRSTEFVSQVFVCLYIADELT